ncbi:MAG: DNA primase [Methylococcales bacterium]|nr:DNA primase [Methylococcales bacterium]
MSGRIPREFIDELLVRVDIVDLIDSHVPLKKTGANYIARCPFHTEKTPSFSVNQPKQFFHCFGCGVSGNAIGFLMNFSHLDFIEAVEDLAGFAGLEIPRASVEYQSEQKKEDLSSLYGLMEQVAAFYVRQLRASEEGKKAVEYLKARGVSGDCAGDFILGYAPDDWRALASRFDQKLLIEAGLLVSKENGQFYDRFRGRIMFPIRNRRARIIGFGGRVTDNSLPKYLNSPETPLFHKGQEVYGLYELLQKNSRPQRILVVEGYMDVIALAQFGIHYAVATLGTATSQAHLDLLFRFSSELVFCFDGDRAGREAAWRAIASVFPSLKSGRQIRIMLLPENHDPDSLVREEGLDKLVERVQTAQVLSEYFFEHFSKDLKLSEMESRSNLRTEAESYLTQLPVGAFREMMFEKLSSLAKQHILDTGAMLSYKKQEKKYRLKQGRPSLPSFVIALLLQNPKFIEIIEQKKVDWDCLEFEGVEKFKNILQVIADKKPANYGVLLEVYRDHADEAIIKKLALMDLMIPDDGVEAEFCDALNGLLKQGREACITRLQAKAQSKGLNVHERETLIKMLANK